MTTILQNLYLFLLTWFQSLPDHARRISGRNKAAPQIESKSAKNVPPPRAPFVVRQYEEHPCTHYMTLKYRFRDIGRMQGIAETLGRDFLTAMPEGAWKSRLGQIAFLHRRIHQDLTNTEMLKLIDSSKTHLANNPTDWDEWDRANLIQMQTMEQKMSPLTGDLIEKQARYSYEGRRQHRDCLLRSDWKAAEGFLSSTVDLTRKIAEARAEAIGETSLYQIMVNEYMPGIRVEDIDGWFKTTDKAITNMLPKILEKQNSMDAPLDLKDFYPAKAQMWLNRAMLSTIGFDFNRGGLYETGHNPVEGGTPDDTRLVIKTVDIDNFLDSLKSALHEGGHGIYIQGLPRKVWRYQPAAQDMGAAIHESQALIIEMIIGRTREFYEYLSPRVEGLFHGLHNPVLSAENLHKTKTWVTPSTMRKKADEVTYFSHVKHRYQLEKGLIEGTLKVADLQDAWNSSMEDIFGVVPVNIAEGCLQDVHWFVGKFGYFPSYAIGHMLAAQIFNTMTKEILDIENQITRGDFMPATNWLRDNIHSKGRLLSFQSLVSEATGKKLNPKYLIDHLEKRYLGSGRHKDNHKEKS